MTLAITTRAAMMSALDLLNLQKMIDKLFADGWITLWLLDDF